MEVVRISGDALRRSEPALRGGGGSSVTQAGGRESKRAGQGPDGIGRVVMRPVDSVVTSGGRAPEDELDATGFE